MTSTMEVTHLFRTSPLRRNVHHQLGCRVEMPKVLLIEDHPRLRESLTHSLEDTGCEVVSAGNGVSGFLEFLRNPPDLVVLDLQLPDINGLLVLAEIRERSPNVPVVIMTTEGAPVHSAIPSVVVLRKPFVPASFLDKVTQALGDARRAIVRRPRLLR